MKGDYFGNYITIIITRTETKREVYLFHLGSDCILYLAEYLIQERPSPRHKWRTVGLYEAIAKGKGIGPKDVPWSDEIKEMARNAVVARLRFAFDTDKERTATG